MDTKTLLEQANERVKNINRIMGELEDFEAVLSVTGTSKVALHSNGGTTFIDTVLSQDDMINLQDMVVARIIGARNKKTAELEQLLGMEKRKTAIINPKFEKAILEMEEQKTKKTLVIDSGTAKCAVVQKDNPVMTVEEVTRLYVTENKTLKEVAEYFGVTKSAVNSYIYRNNLARKSYVKNDDTFLDSKIEAKRKERP
ncbi:MAG: hypothetical protein K0R92_2931 [Lachnospiraceae bacterium]|jgi:transposase|nr:hypothetical protein [Lachnospiraceae bacterium]